MFTQSQEKGKLPNSWDSNRINIVFFTSSEDEFVAIGKDWDNALLRKSISYHIKNSQKPSTFTKI